MDEKGRFGELSTQEIQEIMDKTVLETTKKGTKFGMRLFNDSHRLSFNLKLQNFKYDRRDFKHNNNNNIYINLAKPKAENLIKQLFHSGLLDMR